MENFTKVVRIGVTEDYSRPSSVFCKIELKDGRLSIVGVEGPTTDGNCHGSWGQISQPNITEYAEGWSESRMEVFFSTWERWHLNDMKAGSYIQEEFLRAHPVTYKYPESHFEVACKNLAEAGLNPDADGYRYGSALKREEVPQEVLEWLKQLPDEDRKPAWI